MRAPKDVVLPLRDVDVHVDVVDASMWKDGARAASASQAEIQEEILASKWQTGRIGMTSSLEGICSRIFLSYHS